jgi:hypothetical protein
VSFGVTDNLVNEKWATSKVPVASAVVRSLGSFAITIISLPVELAVFAGVLIIQGLVFTQTPAGSP